jgi:hypothetical protein
MALGYISVGLIIIIIIIHYFRKIFSKIYIP